MCYIETDSHPDVWNETERKARKEHKCSCCLRTIAVGETYTYHFSVFEGDRTINKCCKECEADRDAFAAAHGGVLSPPDDFVYMIANCISENDDEEEPSEADWRPMLARINAGRKAYRESKEKT